MKKLLFVIIILLLLLVMIQMYPSSFHKIFNSKYYRDIYFEKGLSKDYTMVREKRIVFCGIARDVENHILKSIDMCSQIGSYFKDYNIIIFESDSQDKTRDIIRSCDNPHVKMIECEQKLCRLGMKESSKQSKEEKISKLVYLRNNYITHIKQNYADYDYVCVIDFNAEGCMNLDGFMSNFRIKENWDAIACNGKQAISLMSTKIRSSNSYIPYYMDIEFFRGAEYKNKYIKQMIERGIKENESLQQPYRVKSEFNGACLYKMSSIIDKEYDSGWLSEHISLHRNLENIFINPMWEFYIGEQRITK